MRTIPVTPTKGAPMPATRMTDMPDPDYYPHALAHWPYPAP